MQLVFWSSCCHSEFLPARSGGSTGRADCGQLGRFDLLGYGHSSVYKFFIFTNGLKQTGYPVPGCRSCLLRPQCGGRFENPRGTLILYPDPRTCQYSSGMVINIHQHPLLSTLSATLRKVESEKLGAEIANAFRGQAHGEMLEVLKFHLIELPEEVVAEESMERISCLFPFAEGIISQHMPFHWSAYHNRPVNVVVRFLLAIVLSSMAHFFYGCNETNPASLNKRPFCWQTNRFPWSKLPRDDSTDFSSRSGTGQLGISQSFGAPLSFNLIFELNEAVTSPWKLIWEWRQCCYPRRSPSHPVNNCRVENYEK